MAKQGLKREQNRFAALLLLPGLLTVVVFTSIPALTTLSYAFFNWEGFQRGTFAGIANFQKLFQFPFVGQFFAAFKHNIFVFIGIYGVQTSLGILLAYALFKLPKGQRFFRTVAFFPVIFSLVVVGYLWQLILNPFYGPVNYVLHHVHLDSLALTWLGETKTALPTLVFINLWRWVGFPTIIFLAGFNAISTDFIEAARIDGATEGQIFRKVLLPLLAPSFTIVTILTFIGAFEWFDLPYIIGGSGGNPEGSIDTLALMFYRLSFGSVDSGANNVGVGSALGVVIFAFVGVGAAVGTKYLRAREVEA
ncbi:MAG: putative sugar transporter, permease protein [Actinomycetota bacterium]